MKIDISRVRVLTAMQMEARAITQRLPTVNVMVIGLRAVRLPRDLTSRNATCIILAGLGGALDPALRIGDLVLDDRAGLIPKAVDMASRFKRGAIHTAANMVATAADKAELFERTKALAVDMETDIVRRAAELMNVPFIGLRAISDCADQAIDPRVVSLIDEVGNPRPLAVASFLMTHPGLIGHLRRLEQQSKDAANAMGAAVAELISALRSCAVPESSAGAEVPPAVP
jgi:hypothetical protein